MTLNQAIETEKQIIKYLESLGGNPKAQWELADAKNKLEGLLHEQDHAARAKEPTK